MNLLITNAYELQAYVIAYSLQAEADRIIITEGGESLNPTGFRGMLPYSRLVDASYRVPHFAADWLAGRVLQDDNTPAEEAYVQRIEEICAAESVDTIFPSLDPEIHLFAKNKQRLFAKGIVVVVPELEVIRVPMDKGLTIQAAQRVGFPCPNTYFPQNNGDIDRIADESTPPWIVKPRIGAHGHRMLYARDRSELTDAVRPVSDAEQWPIVQEYIPGGSLRMYNLMVGHDSEILSLLTPDSIRAFRGGYRVSHRTAISSSTGPCVAELRNLIRELRLWGAYTVQTKVDPRDDLPKLMEINARFGHTLWRRTELGVNEPLVFLQLARAAPVTTNLTYPDGVLMLEPLSDFMYLCRQLIETLPGFAPMLEGRDARRLRDSIEVNPRGVRETLRVYLREYVNARRKVFKPDVSRVLVDPWPCVRSFCHQFHREVNVGLGRVWKTFTRKWRAEK
jgi:predicted ATP-grasp superfamily ATP-dependent carboligase